MVHRTNTRANTWWETETMWRKDTARLLICGVVEPDVRFVCRDWEVRWNEGSLVLCCTAMKKLLSMDKVKDMVLVTPIWLHHFRDDYFWMCKLCREWPFLGNCMLVPVCHIKVVSINFKNIFDISTMLLQEVHNTIDQFFKDDQWSTFKVHHFSVMGYKCHKQIQVWYLEESEAY